MISLRDARTAFRTFKKSYKVEETVFLIWINRINKKLYKVLYRLFPEKYHSIHSFTTVADDNSYPLPSDFGTLKARGCGLFQFNEDDTTEKKTKEFPYTESGSTKDGFYIDGTTLYKTPKPSIADTYHLIYIPSLSRMTSNSDTMVVDEDYMELVQDWLSAYNRVKREDPSALIQIDKMFADEALNDLKDEFTPYQNTTVRAKLAVPI